MHIKKSATLICVVAMLSSIATTSCKPTEKGYRSAYDIAQTKKTNNLQDPDLNLSGMVEENAPTWHVVDGDSVLVRVEPLSLDGTGSLHKYNVAVAAYRMRANARSHAERLRDEHLTSAVLENNDDIYYAIAGQFDTLAEAAKFANQYLSHHRDIAYPMLPGRPVIEIPTHLAQ